jgi:hypothetical protein
MPRQIPLWTLAFAIAILGSWAGHARAAEVTIDCIAPTTNTDGSKLTDLAGFVLYGANQGEPPKELDRKKVTEGCHFVRPTVSVGAHVYYVTAFTAAAESDMSEPYTQVVPPTKPAAPIGVTGKVTGP